MFRVVDEPRSRLWTLASVLALALGVAACSAESTRFNENPFASQGNPDATGSVRPVQGAPVGRVESQPLPPAASAGVSGGSRGMASYAPPGPAPVASHPAVASRPPAVASRPLPPPDVTGSVAPIAAQPARPAAGGSWTWEGGTPISVAQGDTVETISRRYGVPPSALMHANNITASPALYPGQQLA